MEEPEYPVVPNPEDEDIEYAQKAVIIHKGQDWPSGKLCINCHAHWPCSLRRWGIGALRAAGWVQDDIDSTLRRAASGIVPWL